jgi:hypothetical protein
MSFYDLTRRVVARVRGVPFPLVVDELREAAIRFFQRTEVWRETLDAMQFAAGQTAMELDLPSGSALVSISGGAVDGEDLAIAGYGVSQIPPESLVLGFVPPTSCTVVVEAVLKPSYASEGLPRALEAEYGRAIAEGAVAALKAMRGTEWYDPEGAAISLDQFKREMAAAKRRRIQGKANRSMRVQPVSFF